MKKEYIKPTLSVDEVNVDTEIASLALSGNTTYGTTVDGSSIWADE